MSSARVLELDGNRTGARVQANRHQTEAAKGRTSRRWSVSLNIAQGAGESGSLRSSGARNLHAKPSGRGAISFRSLASEPSRWSRSTILAGRALADSNARVTVRAPTSAARGDPGIREFHTGRRRSSHNARAIRTSDQLYVFEHGADAIATLMS